MGKTSGLRQFQDHMGIMMQERIEFLYLIRRITLYIFPLISRQDTFCMMESAFTRCFDIDSDSSIIPMLEWLISVSSANVIYGYRIFSTAFADYFHFIVPYFQTVVLEPLEDVSVNKFSLKPSSQYSYSFMGRKYRVKSTEP